MKTNARTESEEPVRRIEFVDSAGELHDGEQRILDFYVSARAAHGDLVQLYHGNESWYLASNPAEVQHVLVDAANNYRQTIVVNRSMTDLLGGGLLTSDGSDWSRQRRALRGCFAALDTSRILHAIVDSAEKIVDDWRAGMSVDRVFDLQREMNRLSIEVAGKTLFGVDLGPMAGTIASAIRRVIDAPAAPERNQRLDREAREEALTAVRAIARWILGECAACPDDTLIKALARAYGVACTSESQLLLDETATLLVTGFETCSNTLIWANYLLHSADSAYEAVKAEAEALDFASLDVHSADWLIYTAGVVDEALRLFPPVWVLGRQALLDDVLRNHRISSGSLVVLSPYVTHRHPDFWPHPDRFDPERFLCRRTVEPRFAYFPFGGGPRHCIAHRLALVQVRILVGYIARGGRFSGMPKSVGAVPATTLLPQGPLMVRFDPA